MIEERIQMLIEKGAEPLVSVVLPVYNGEKYLAEAINSILAQTFGDFEFIIIDDGSTDGTATMLKHFKQIDTRIRVYHQENQGLIASLNRGCDLAQGKYIARMDQDDVSLPERFAIQVDYLERNPEVGLVSTNCYLIDSASKITHGPILQGGLCGAELEWGLYWGNPIVHPSVMGYTTVFRSYGGYPAEHVTTEDYALWLRMVIDTRIVVLQQPLLLLRKHGQNMTTVKLRFHLEQTAHVVQTALTERLGYRPPEVCICFIRHIELDHLVTADEFNQALNLLLNAFQEIVARYNLDASQARWIQTDLARRLLDLVLRGPRCGKLGWALCQAAHLSPQSMISRPGILALTKSLFGQRMIDSLRRLKRQKQSA